MQRAGKERIVLIKRCEAHPEWDIEDDEREFSPSM